MPAKVGKLLSKATSTRIADIRAAVQGANLAGSLFAAVEVISGPFALVGLVIGGILIVSKSVPNQAGSRAIEVPIQSLPSKPFDISWSIFAAHDISELGAFLNVNGSIIKLGTKTNLAKGKLWTGERTIV